MRAIDCGYKVPKLYGNEKIVEKKNEVPEITTQQAVISSSLPNTMTFLGVNRAKININTLMQKINKQTQITFKGSEEHNDSAKLDEILDSLENNPNKNAQKVFVILYDLQKAGVSASKLVETCNNCMDKETKKLNLEKLLEDIKNINSTDSTKQTEAKPVNNQGEVNNLKDLLALFNNSAEGSTEKKAFKAINELQEVNDQYKFYPDLEGLVVLYKKYVENNNENREEELNSFIEIVENETFKIPNIIKVQEASVNSDGTKIDITDINNLLTVLGNFDDNKEALNSVINIKEVNKKYNYDANLDTKIVKLFKERIETGKNTLEEFTAMMNKTAEEITIKFTQPAEETKPIENETIPEITNSRNIPQENGEKARQVVLENISKILPELIKTFKLTDGLIAKTLKQIEEPINKNYETLLQYKPEELLDDKNIDNAVINLGGILEAIENVPADTTDPFLTHEKQIPKFMTMLDKDINKINELKEKFQNSNANYTTEQKYELMKNLFAFHQGFCADAKQIADSVINIKQKLQSHINYLAALKPDRLKKDEVFNLLENDKDNQKLVSIFTKDDEDKKLLSENKIDEYKQKKINQILDEVSVNPEFENYLADKIIENDAVTIRLDMARIGIMDALVELDKANNNLVTLTMPIDESIREIGYLHDTVCKDYLGKFIKTFLQPQGNQIESLQKLLDNNKPLDENLSTDEAISIINVMSIVENAISLLPMTANYADEMTDLFNNQHVKEELYELFETKPDFWTNKAVQNKMEGLKGLEKGFVDINNEIKNGIIKPEYDKKLASSTDYLSKYMNQLLEQIKAKKAKETDTETPQKTSDKAYLDYSLKSKANFIDSIKLNFGKNINQYPDGIMSEQFKKDLEYFENTFLPKFQEALEQKLSKDSRIVLDCIIGASDGKPRIKLAYNCKNKYHETFLYHLTKESISKANLYDEETGSFKWLDKLAIEENPAKETLGSEEKPQKITVL